jgi:hypothetical protein
MRGQITANAKQISATRQMLPPYSMPYCGELIEFRMKLVLSGTPLSSNVLIQRRSAILGFGCAVMHMILVRCSKHAKAVRAVHKQSVA